MQTNVIRLQYSTHNDALIAQKIILVSLQIYKIAERVNVFHTNIFNDCCNSNSIFSFGDHVFLLY